MSKISNFTAAIFDLDDTLLDNIPGGNIVAGLHEQSRLKAAHVVGKRDHIPELLTLSLEDNYRAFADAPVHTLEGAVWGMLCIAGLRSGDVIIKDDPLLKEIVALKNEMHEEVLREHGKEVAGAAHFLRALAAHGFAGHFAIASTAVHRDALLSLEIIGVRDLFPDERIITKEQFDHPKPNPEPFIKALASLGNPEAVKTLAFEDDPRGIMSAKAAGLYTCAITTRYTKKDLADLKVAPDLIADSYAEFEKLFGL